MRNHKKKEQQDIIQMWGYDDTKKQRDNRITIWSDVYIDEANHMLIDEYLIDSGTYEERKRIKIQEKYDELEDEMDREIFASPRDRYQIYLKSADWQERRKKALDRAEHRCQLSNRTYRLQIHHRTYKNRGNEKDQDLTVLCERCHDWWHKSFGMPDQ
jgi:hypothetical protein